MEPDLVRFKGAVTQYTRPPQLYLMGCSNIPDSTGCLMQSCAFNGYKAEAYWSHIMHVSVHTHRAPGPQQGRRRESKPLFRGHRQSSLPVCPVSPAMVSPSGSDPVYAQTPKSLHIHHAGCVHRNTDWKTYW